ncbi:hypothetical protein HOO65_060223 [Ceratocystis lukuohia]|uniref:F-box domain-containing protein n=2 Tax=Ceratocystis TaxID=5157 RepID=A0A0F8AWA3_CERFI|nr:hypothetical protein CFO_g5506 [Ceratocystis platani]
MSSSTIHAQDFMSVLPPECCDMVWQLLPSDALHSCMLVSKLWYSDVVPLLYKDVVLECDNYFFQKFSQAMRNSPHLALMVRSLTFTHSDRLAKDIDYFMVKCIEPLRNLQCLRLDGAFSGFGKRLAQMEERGSCFPHLKELHLGTHGQMLADVSHVWKLPALQSLQVVIGDYTRYEFDFSSWPMAENLKSLSLSCANIDYQRVSSLLSLAPGLCRLDFVDFRDVTEQESAQDYSKLKLEQLADLECLMLGVITYSKMHNVDVMDIMPERGHLQPITNLKRLHKLDVSVNSLLGWYPEEAPRISDVIPTSLTTLTLNDDCVGQCGYKWTEKQLITRLWDLLRATTTGNTNVQTIEFGPLGDRWTGETLDELRQVIKQSGSRFEEEMVEGHGQYLKIHV